MNRTLKDLIELNCSMIIRVEGDDVVLRVGCAELRVPYHPLEQPLPITGRVGHRNGSLNVVVTSDIFNVFELDFKMKDFEEVTIKELVLELLEASIQFIAKIIVEVDTPVLIQSSYSKKDKRFISNICLVDDLPIIFANIQTLN